MRDEKKSSRILIQKIAPLIITLLLLIATFPSTLGLQEKNDTFSFLIEFTMPNLFQQINQQSSQNNNHPILFSHFLDETLNNISLFQQSALTKIKNVIEIDPFSNDIKHYHLFFNGMRISEITEQDSYQIEKLPFVKHVEKDMVIYSMSISANHSSDYIIPYTDDYSYLSTKINDSYSGRNISIGFFDTGLDYTHPALSSIYKSGYDFVNEDDDPFDDNGHGTHVIGITAAQPLENDSNNIIKGNAPNASIYVYKVLDEEGKGYTSWFLSAFERALDPNQDGDFSDHMDIISISAGNPEGSASDILSKAAEQAVAAGITVVAAAGNAGPTLNTISSPAIAQDVIAVGASITDEIIAPYSSRGGLDNKVIKPDVVAPGHQITSTWPNNQYKTLSGTSMATPYVTGIIACLLEKHPNFTPREIQTILHSTATPIGYNVTAEGYGLIDMINVLEMNSTFLGNISAYQLPDSNKLLINLSLQNNQSMISYSVKIYPINNHQIDVLTVNQQQTDEKNTQITVSIQNINTGYHILFVELSYQQSVTRVKQIIFLKNNDQQFSCCPSIVTVGEKFTCSLSNATTSTLPLFIFCVPFRSIQFHFGLNATFTTPQLPFRLKEQIIAHLFIIKIGFPLQFEKHKITIITNFES